MKTSLIILTLVMTAILSGCQTTEPVVTTDEIMEPKDDDAMDNEEMSDETASEDIYMDFTQEAYDSMLGQEPFALFFHASWCPTCQSMERDIMSTVEEFPEGSKILKVDYDTETELKEQYGITSQSIVVMINADGSVAETLAAPSAEALQNSFTELLQ